MYIEEDPLDLLGICLPPLSPFPHILSEMPDPLYSSVLMVLVGLWLLPSLGLQTEAMWPSFPQL